MQAVVKNDKYEKSRIVILPFVNLPPSDLNALNSALCFALNECDKRNITFCPVTFDQLLYIKTVDNVKSTPCLKEKLFGQLGRFHLLMSYLGSVGAIMNGSGLEMLWELVYNGNTATHD